MTPNFYAGLFISLVMLNMLAIIAENRAIKYKLEKRGNRKLWEAILKASTFLVGCLTLITAIAMGGGIFYYGAQLLGVESTETLIRIGGFGSLAGVGMAGGAAYSYAEVDWIRLGKVGSALFFIRNILIGGLFMLIFVLASTALIIVVFLSAVVITLLITATNPGIWVYIIGIALIFLILLISFYDF